MRNSFRIYLRREGKRGHEEVVVHIDWQDVNELDLKRLAALYVLRRVEHELKGWETSLPESVEYRAADFMNNEPLLECRREVPAKWKEPPKSKARREFEALVGDLSPEDIRILLGSD